MSKHKNLEDLFLDLKAKSTRASKEFDLVYDNRLDCFWFGEKKEGKK